VAKPGELARAVREVGFPLALKIVSPDVVHKTEIGAVRVGITGEQDASRSYDEVLAAVRLHAPRARVDGALVQQMVEGITETIVGVTRDPVYGPLVMFGLGGVFVEALRDVVFRIAPVDDAQAREMVDGIRGRMLLEGFRGGPSADRAALASVVRRIGQLAADFPEITELDVNPLMALETGAIAVDARISIRPGGQGRGAGVQR
jgi:acetyltransferase